MTRNLAGILDHLAQLQTDLGEVIELASLSVMRRDKGEPAKAGGQS